MIKLNKRYGKWKVLDTKTTQRNGEGYVRAQCECGKIKWFRPLDLRRGRSTSCHACRMRERNPGYYNKGSVKNPERIMRRKIDRPKDTHRNLLGKKYGNFTINSEAFYGTEGGWVKWVRVICECNHRTKKRLLDVINGYGRVRCEKCYKGRTGISIRNPQTAIIVEDTGRKKTIYYVMVICLILGNIIVIWLLRS